MHFCKFLSECFLGGITDILTTSLQQSRLWFNYSHESQSCHCYPRGLQNSLLVSVLQLIDISPWQQHAWCCAFREGQRTLLEGLWWLLDAWSLADGWESAYRKYLFGWIANINITQLALQRRAWLYIGLYTKFSGFSLLSLTLERNTTTSLLCCPHPSNNVQR